MIDEHAFRLVKSTVPLDNFKLYNTAGWVMPTLSNIQLSKKIVFEADEIRVQPRGLINSFNADFSRNLENIDTLEFKIKGRRFLFRNVHIPEWEIKHDETE